MFYNWFLLYITVHKNDGRNPGICFILCSLKIHNLSHQQLFSLTTYVVRSSFNKYNISETLGSHLAVSMAVCAELSLGSIFPEGYLGWKCQRNSICCMPIVSSWKWLLESSFGAVSQDASRFGWKECCNQLAMSAIGDGGGGDNDDTHSRCLKWSIKECTLTRISHASTQ